MGAERSARRRLERAIFGERPGPDAGRPERLRYIRRLWVPMTLAAVPALVFLVLLGSTAGAIIAVACVLFAVQSVVSLTLRIRSAEREETG